jgi:hypothetical protein
MRDRTNSPRNRCSVCGAEGVNKRTCPSADPTWSNLTELRSLHEELAKPKIHRASTQSVFSSDTVDVFQNTPPDGWGSLNPHWRVTEVTVEPTQTEQASTDARLDDLEQKLDVCIGLLEMLGIHLGALWPNPVNEQ